MTAVENAKLFTKSTLVKVSHAIERAALVAAEDGPMLVMSLFQRMPYFERERQVYERIAARAAVTVVGLVGEHTVDGPFHLIPLAEHEPWAREWSVVVLTPRFGAVLEAVDREQVSESAATLEAGRLFDGRWSLRRDDALHKALALQAAFADRLPPPARAALDNVLSYVRDVPASAGESRADALLRLLIEHTERTGTELAGLRRRIADRSPLTGPDEVGRWSGAGGVTASGTLPVALLAVRVPAAHQLPEQTGRRTGALRDEGLVAVLAKALRDTDRLTRLSENDFLLLLPALSLTDAVKVAHRLQADLAEAAGRNAFLPGSAHMVVLETRRRPFPTERIGQALTWAQQQQVPLAQLEDA